MVEIKARTPFNEGQGRLEELAADPHNVRTGAQRDPVEVDSRGTSSRMSGLAPLPWVTHGSPNISPVTGRPAAEDRLTLSRPYRRSPLVRPAGCPRHNAQPDYRDATMISALSSPDGAVLGTSGPSAEPVSVSRHRPSSSPASPRRSEPRPPRYSRPTPEPGVRARGTALRDRSLHPITPEGSSSGSRPRCSSPHERTGASDHRSFWVRRANVRLRRRAAHYAPERHDIPGVPWSSGSPVVARRSRRRREEVGNQRSCGRDYWCAIRARAEPVSSFSRPESLVVRFVGPHDDSVLSCYLSPLYDGLTLRQEKLSAWETLASGMGTATSHEWRAARCVRSSWTPDAIR